MTRLTISYDLAVRDIPHSADAAEERKSESVPHRYITDPATPMDCTLAPPDTRSTDGPVETP